jgi:hypothetical protein
MDRMCTTWVLGEYRQGEDTYDEQLRVIDGFVEKLEKTTRIPLRCSRKSELEFRSGEEGFSL